MSEMSGQCECEYGDISLTLNESTPFYSLQEEDDKIKILNNKVNAG